MTTPLAQQLRTFAEGEARSGIGRKRWAILRDAADEIDRLQAAWDASIAERDELQTELRAVVDARRAALEEAARLVQRSGQSDDLIRIAAAIRVLKEQNASN